MEGLDKVLDEYAYESELFSVSYDMMGQMLDREHVKKRTELLKASHVYIYGGGYLGIQFYNAVNQFVNILSVVDKSGKLLIEIPDIPVINLDEFKTAYEQEIVIITPIKHYKSIYMELSEFIPKDKMIFLGEFLGGIL